MRRFLLFSSLLFTAACTADADPTAVTGSMVYSQTVTDGNTFTCATCHALMEPAQDGLRRPGHALGGAPGRPSYKNGQLTNMLDAVNSCLEEWMNASKWTEDDLRYLALVDYLDEQATPEGMAAVEFEIVQPPVDPTGGDAVQGQQLFNESCVVCHGTDAGGTQRAPALGGLGLEADYVARRIRTSGRNDSSVYDGLTGGVMPFWAADRLSDDEVRNLAAFISTSSVALPTPDPDPEPDPNPEPQSCASTHPSVGRTATLRTFFHRVEGIAEIIDDCTIEIRDFGFDGGGVNVQIYGGVNNNYDDGFSISGNLVRRTAYEGETLTLKLPQGRSLDDLDGISVWCVPVGVDFGSGQFR